MNHLDICGSRSWDMELHMLKFYGPSGYVWIPHVEYGAKLAVVRNPHMLKTYGPSGYVWITYEGYGAKHAQIIWIIGLCVEPTRVLWSETCSTPTNHIAMYGYLS